MPVTINANGLSIIHEDSGGKASATLPDVCLTVVGPSVVPIPYTNSAKSSDLADGSKTVTADGGNSIAIKSCSFSKSSGDAAGTNKGIVSGTTEGKAEFITSSPTVKIEGKGVCRLSDQMTMNNMNTMCLAGADNDSVTVVEDPEGTYTVDLSCRYPDGEPLQNAPFKLIDIGGKILKEGELDAQGKGSVSNLKSGNIKIELAESKNDFLVTPVRYLNFRYHEILSDEAFFESVSQGKPLFWQANRISLPVKTWGAMGKSLVSDYYFSEMMRLEVRSHFKMTHSNFNFDSLSECIIASIENSSIKNINKVVIYSLPCLIEEGEILSVLLRLPKHEMADHMLAYMRARGKGDPRRYLKDYDWESAINKLNSELESLLQKLINRIEFLSLEASKKNYTHLSSEIYDLHVNTINTFIKSLPDILSTSLNQLKTHSEKLLLDVSQVYVIRAYDHLYSAEAGNIVMVVNTTQTIDLEEQKWVKIRAIHNDRWQTPLLAENIKVTTDSVVHAEKVALNKNGLTSTISETKELAIETEKNESGVVVFDNLKINTEDILVEFNAEFGIEQEIEQAYKSIEIYLDGIYNKLIEDMSDFQREWEEKGILTLGDGVISGSKIWGNDLIELLSPAIWKEMGQTLSSSFSDSFDYLYNYANESYNSVTESITDEKGKLNNPSWFISQLKEDLSHIQNTAYETIDDHINYAESLYSESKNFVLKLKCIAKNKKKIMNLPRNFAEGDIDEIEIFIDTVLAEFDPEWAKEIKEGENLKKALVIINDNSSAMIYSAYFSLIFEAIPPNFYTYHVGKIGAYILLEVILTLILSVLTFGVGTAARISTIIAKFTLGTKKLSKLNHAEKALITFTETMNAMLETLHHYEKLVDKLINRPMNKIKGKANKTLTAIKYNIKRNKKCRLCLSDKHKTPKSFNGEVNYV